MLFLTDGVPSFPIGRGDTIGSRRHRGGDQRGAARARPPASRSTATRSGRRRSARRSAVTEIARVTLGTYTPVMNPGDIVALLQGVSFANIEDVVLSNLTTGELSTDVRLNPDGSFNGFVPVREGKNQIRVKALASDGTSGSANLELEFARSQLTHARDGDRARAHPPHEQGAAAAARAQAHRRLPQQGKEGPGDPGREASRRARPATATAPSVLHHVAAPPRRRAPRSRARTGCRRCRRCPGRPACRCASGRCRRPRRS